jgi:hypothetical protein
VEVPGDWTVAITDVRGSTAAIEAGRYRDVNLVGAACITAAVNAARGVELAYVFGGDGATLLFPSGRLDAIRGALLSVQAIARAQFALELRVGCVAVAELRAAGQSTRVAKLRIADGVCLAMLGGGGPGYAERLIKTDERYLLRAASDQPPDLDGLECRWEPLAARNGEVLSVLIKARDGDGRTAADTYREVIDAIGRLAGEHGSLNPARPTNLRLSLSPAHLAREARIKASVTDGLRARLGGVVRIFLQTLLGWFLMLFRARTGDTDWGRYREEVARNTDYWKYDDTLRFVIDVTPAQKRALVACFDELERKGQIVYGVHAAPEALMTCLVFDRAGRHVHFIDGGDGGYARAAKQLKAKL